MENIGQTGKEKERLKNGLFMGYAWSNFSKNKKLFTVKVNTNLKALSSSQTMVQQTVPESCLHFKIYSLMSQLRIRRQQQWNKKGRKWHKHGISPLMDRQ